MSQRGKLVYQIIGTSANLIRDVWNNISYSHKEVLSRPLVNRGFTGFAAMVHMQQVEIYTKLIIRFVINTVEKGRR